MPWGVQARCAPGGVSKTWNCRGGLYETLTNLLPDEGIVCAVSSKLGGQAWPAGARPSADSIKAFIATMLELAHMVAAVTMVLWPRAPMAVDTASPNFLK